MNRVLSFVTLWVLFFACVPAFAVEKEVKKEEVPEQVTVRIWAVRGYRCVELPPDVDYEVDGKYLGWIESDEASTRIFLAADSIEVYASKKLSAAPKKIKIEPFQLGPGFYMPHGWHVATGRKPRD